MLAVLAFTLVGLAVVGALGLLWVLWPIARDADLRSIDRQQQRRDALARAEAAR